MATDKSDEAVKSNAHVSEQSTIPSMPAAPEAVKSNAHVSEQSTIPSMPAAPSTGAGDNAPAPGTSRPTALNGNSGLRPLIEVRNLKKNYSLGQTTVHALRGISLAVYPGEFVAVMGPSGSGKSTFMNMIGCLDRPTSGEYWLSGRLVSSLSSDELADVRNRLIGFVFQGFNLLSRATALSNVALPMVYAGVPKDERESRARRALQLVGLGKRLHHKPSQLSGGQQQRVAIARALVNSPSLVLADEPTGNLDSRTSTEVMAILQALNEQGLTIVLVTHEPDIAHYAKRQIAFRDGLLVRDEPVLAPRSAREEWIALTTNKQSSGQLSTVQDKKEAP
jgi:putative ABC transport system ATP-binding protein